MSDSFRRNLSKLTVLHVDRVKQAYEEPMKRRTRKGNLSEPIAVLNRVDIVENGNPLVEVVNGEDGIYVCCDRRIWLRQAVVGMLLRAQKMLPPSLHLFIFEGFRSLQRQRDLYERFYARSFVEHPDWPSNIRRREINRFVAPPDVKCPPGHCTGGAVDLTLIDDEGEELDMVSPCGLMMANSPTFTEDLTREAQVNRELLFNVMERFGFKNYPFEWWHYSYGDSGWAYRKKRKTCFYSAPEPPPEYKMPPYELE